MDRVECDADDTFFTLIRFESGPVGNMAISWAGHGESVSIPRTIYGSKGCIKGSEVILHDGTRMNVRDLFASEASAEIKERFFPMGLTDLDLDGIDGLGFALETYEFLRAIQEGREMETSGREGLRDMAVSYAVIESSRLKRSVKIREIETGEIEHYEREINEYYGL